MARADLQVTVEGVPEVEAALALLPGEARKILRRKARELARHLATKIRAAGQADTKQSARAARTVKVRNSTVTAGPHPVLYGSEFGANGRYGFYSKPQFQDSVNRQF